MRNFQTLDQYTVENETGILYIGTDNDHWMHPRVSMRREGTYIAISASYGPMEIAMRLHFDEFVRALAKLRPVKGLQTTRQIGTGQAYIAIGLQEEGGLVLRPTIVADATGHVVLNLAFTNDVRQILFTWLNI